MEHLDRGSGSKGSKSAIGDSSPQAEKWKKVSIYKVPCCIKGGNEDKQRAYTPRTVSIGPYHHGQYHLQAMEEHKQRALLHFLKRSNKSLEAFVEPLSKVVEDLLDSYDALDSSWENDRNKFLQLMIVDGVFILEVLSSGITKSDYADNDPIFNPKRLMLSIIKSDILTLENQLLMPVLVKLIAVQTNNSKVNACIYWMCVGRSLFLRKRTKMTAGHPPSFGIPISEAQYNETLYPAKLIRAAKVWFKASNTRSLESASFKVNSDGGFLRIACIRIDQDSETFLNLVAFERLQVEAGNEVTSYLSFMKSFIKDETDVKVLTSPEIIRKTNVNDKTVVDIFNSLPDDITVDPTSNLAMVRKDLNRYGKNPLSVFITSFLLSPEFRDPVKIISYVIAYMLPPLTAAQTYFSVLSYYNRR
ncbi:UPF0481 protein At3g47200-like [Hibiscus syriacus]|nr:UPF0481 protein At3g47200-like [Hibiscus syriacus]